MLPRDVFGEQDKAVLPGKQDGVKSQNTLHKTTVAPHQTAFQCLTHRRLLAIQILETLPEGAITRCVRQEVGQFQKLQLAVRVIEHTQKCGVGIAASVIEDEQGTFCGGFDQGLIPFCGFMQAINHLLAFLFNPQTLLKHKYEQ